jgi:hypothetical protein
LNEIESMIAQLERQGDAVDRALLALREIEGAGAAAPVKRRGRPPGKRKGGGMSAEGRARIGEATRRRWALKRAAEAAGSKKTVRAGKKAVGGRRPMSAEGRANIVAAAKRMWAKKNASKKTARKKRVEGQVVPRQGVNGLTRYRSRFK